MEAGIFVVITIIILSGTVGSIFAANNLKLCFSGSESDSLGNATFSCPDGQGIHISDALFGRNKWGSCVLLDGDCVEKTRIFQNCENQSTCSRQFKTYTTACGYSTVMFLSYTCLPVDLSSMYTPTPETTYFQSVETFVGKLSDMSTNTVESSNGNNGGSPSEAGLIAGCVIAATITIIALIIAVTIIVRRLLGKDKYEDDKDTDSSHNNCSSTCCYRRSETNSIKQMKKSAATTTDLGQQKIQTSGEPTVSHEDHDSLPISACTDVDGTSSVPHSQNAEINSSVPDHSKHHRVTDIYNSKHSTLDSNSNSRMKSANKMKEESYDEGKKSLAILNKDSTSGKQCHDNRGEKNDEICHNNVNTFTYYNTLLKSKGTEEFNVSSSFGNPEIDSAHYKDQTTTANGGVCNLLGKLAVSIPNTHRGTAC